MEKENVAAKTEILRICWNMRGSITYNDAMLLSSEDITIISKIIGENTEITNKTGLPYF